MQVLIFLDENEETILDRYMKENHCSSKNNAIKQIIRKTEA